MACTTRRGALGLLPAHVPNPEGAARALFESESGNFAGLRFNFPRNPLAAWLRRPGAPIAGRCAFVPLRASTDFAFFVLANPARLTAIGHAPALMGLR